MIEMRPYFVVYPALKKHKVIMASNPLSAVKKGHKHDGWHWEEWDENDISPMGDAIVYSNVSYKTEIGRYYLVDNG